MGRGFGNPLWAKAPFVLRRYPAPGWRIGCFLSGLGLILAVVSMTGDHACERLRAIV